MADKGAELSKWKNASFCHDLLEITLTVSEVCKIEQTVKRALRPTLEPSPGSRAVSGCRCGRDALAGARPAALVAVSSSNAPGNRITAHLSGLRHDPQKMDIHTLSRIAFWSHFVL